MKSMVGKGFIQAMEKNKICLFKSYKKEYKDGGQERDFLYVKDAVRMTLFFSRKSKYWWNLQYWSGSV